MNKRHALLGILFIALTSNATASIINLTRGNLLDTDTINVERQTQQGNCPTTYPTQSIDCTYTSSNLQGIKAQYISLISQHLGMTTENTYLLNVSVNGRALESCQGLQAKMLTKTLITINQTGCIIS